MPLGAIDVSAAMGGRLQPCADRYDFEAIGYGSRTYLDGSTARLGGRGITMAEAEAMKRHDLSDAVLLVRQAVAAALSNRQAAALILLANYLGPLSKASAMVTRVNAGRWREAADLFRAYINSAGEPSLGLLRRRWCEAAYSLGLVAKTAQRRAWAEIGSVDGWLPLPQVYPSTVADNLDHCAMSKTGTIVSRCWLPDRFLRTTFARRVRWRASTSPQPERRSAASSRNCA